jgi:endoglycosylceramidase
MQKIFIIAFFLLFISVAFSFNFIQVDTDSQLFVDEYGRSRIFRGVNVVYKDAPFHPPITSHFHPNVSLCEEDARNLQNWGMNIVRLLVSWEGVEPTRGNYNMTYINKLKEIVAILAKYDIYVILDFHQDLFSKRTCGNGFPTWLNEDDNGFPSPLPYKLRRDGNNFPLREDCVKHAFFQYYFSKQVNEHFQRLFDDKFNERFSAFWELVVKEFKHFENIFGYEIVNEPWVGDIYKNPALLLSKRGDIENLNPFYKKIVPAIRKHDQDRIILYEPSTVSMAHKEVGVEPPEGKENNHKQVFSYHVYCGIINISLFMNL